MILRVNKKSPKKPKSSETEPCLVACNTAVRCLRVLACVQPVGPDETPQLPTVDAATGEDIHEPSRPATTHEGRKGHAQRIDGRHIDGRRIDVRRIDGRHIDGQRIDMQHIDGQRIDGQLIGGQHIDGQLIDGGV